MGVGTTGRPPFAPLEDDGVVLLLDEDIIDGKRGRSENEKY
jgi:hypothetical protein